MARNIKIIVYPVTDVEKAKAFYSAFLDQEPYVDSPYYIGYRDSDQEVGLDPNAKLGPIGYVEVEDIRGCLDEIVSAGGEIVQDVKDVAEGLLTAQVKDVDGNVVGLRQQP